MATTKAGVGQLLADVQVLSLGAGQTLQSQSGITNTVNTGVVRMTPNSVNSTAPTKANRWDGLYLAVFPGTLAPGATAPDLEMWVNVDGQAYDSWFRIPVGVNNCAFPRRQNAVGAQAVMLGQSMMLAAKRADAGAGVPHNMAGAFTGWKISSNIDFYFYSAAGFNAATFIEPPTVQLYGDCYDDAAVAYVAKNLPWDGTIQKQSMRRALAGMAAYTASHQAVGISMSTWPTLPGGPKQGLLAVQRTFKHAFNAQNVASATPYSLTAIPSLGGANTNIPLGQDLGWDFTKTGNAVEIMEIGRRPGAGAAYFALNWGGGVLAPADTSFGAVCSPGNPRVQFGLVQPLRGEPFLYYVAQPWGLWSAGEADPELIANETACLSIMAANGQTILANTDETLVGGILYTSGTVAS